MEPFSNAVLARYLAGECSADEVDEIERWASTDEAHRVRLDDLRAVWRVRQPARAWDVAGMWHTVEQSMRGKSWVAIVPVARRARVQRPMLGYGKRFRVVGLAAAAAAITALGFTALHYIRPQTTWSSIVESSLSGPAREYATAPGQRATLLLPDGSRLTLAPASRVRIPVAFGRTARGVSLDGEAFFDVVHDTTRPFRIFAKHAIAEDIGTRFSVRAYAEDSTVGVAVEEGAVTLGSASVTLSDRPQGVVLTAGEFGTLAPAGRVTMARGQSAADELAWVTGRLVLSDVPLGDAVLRLGRWYGVEVRLAAPALAGRRVTATFDGETAPDALRFVASFLDLDISRTGNQYTLRSK